MANGACDGVHATRVGGLAVFDVVLTLLLVVVIMLTVIPPPNRTLGVGALVTVACVTVGEVVHVALGINSTIASGITGGDQPCPAATA